MQLPKVRYLRRPAEEANKRCVTRSTIEARYKTAEAAYEAHIARIRDYEALIRSAEARRLELAFELALAYEAWAQTGSGT